MRKKAKSIDEFIAEAKEVNGGRYWVCSDNNSSPINGFRLTVIFSSVSWSYHDMGTRQARVLHFGGMQGGEINIDDPVGVEYVRENDFGGRVYDIISEDGGRSRFILNNVYDKPHFKKENEEPEEA